ncbi:MAG: Stp1/IreP family PP2C-type Ser/Thr phosphatase [Oscillospiraceae bacterium]|jgi:Serine/threonine protein phosphatase|nr:Stp1/IreP family PP2C-type Ser/Thr phosphatase [Oscillospiraceae bacterium]MBQ6160323.1 Stp1/IreP family PP2C-type Ser/Thr phosphatase [Oscillospiraceae bacterium]
MEVWGLTDPGLVRTQNQDYYLLQKLGAHDLLAVVCDGMGGARSGNVASRLAAEVFTEEVKRGYRPGMSQDKADYLLRTAVSIANTAVYENAQLNADMKGMGTTLVAVLVLGKRAYFANVGDSRGYLMNRQGIQRVTLDHSLVELMVQRGELSSEQAKSYPGKNFITRAIGTEQSVECDLYTSPLRQGDCILLCSDGLTNHLADQELLFEVIHGVNKQDCCQRLMGIAKDRGAPDNVTVVLVVC